MPDPQTQRFVVLSEQTNLRSCSGLVMLPEDPKTQLHYKHHSSPDTLEREAQELRRAELVTRQVPGIRPVRMVAFDAGQGFLITENITSSQSLFNYLWNGSSYWSWGGMHPRTAAELGMRLGSWLRYYHNSTYSVIGSAEPCVEWIIEHCRMKLDALKQRAPRCLSGQTHKRLAAYWSGVAKRIGSLPTNGLAQIHGDLDPANILIDSAGNLFLIDFGDTRFGVALEDVARLWNGLWSMCATSVRRRRLIAPCLEALITAYGETEAVLDTAILMLLRTYNSITAILSSVMFAHRLGLTGGYACRQLANVNRHWLQSVDLSGLGNTTVC